MQNTLFIWKQLLLILKKQLKINNVITIIVILAILLSCVQEIGRSSIAPHNPTVNEWDSLYNVCITYLKENEGFVDTPYFCPAGVRSIGYGHVILPGESFGKISKGKADAILRNDFDKSIIYVLNNSNLSGRRLLAMAMFTFALGGSRFNQMYTKRVVKEGKEIDDEIIKWVYYNGKPSKVLKRRRIYELNLFNYGNKEK